MNGYRSTLAGGGGQDHAGDYTFSLIKNGKTTYANGSCRGMFFENTSLNDPVIIGRAVNCCVDMFNGCTSFNQDLDIHGGIDNCYRMLYGCSNFAKNIYFHSRERAINTVGMLQGTSTLRKNVLFQRSMNTYFNNTDASSIMGAPVTWTEITNGFYNAAFNVYCYYNYAN